MRGGGEKKWKKEGEPLKWIKRNGTVMGAGGGNRCKIVNERGLFWVLGLNKVGSEGLAEVL